VLRALDVRDFAIVERVGLEFGPGFTVLSGETGAGKSILVDAIELLVGARGDAACVRDGAERAELSAEFELDASAPLADWVEERGLAGDPGSLILRRTIDRSGRSRCFVNGHAATLAQLREAGEFLVDIHGQHEHQSLLRPAAQRALLDAHAGAEALAGETARVFHSWKRLQALAEDARQQFAQREAERADLEERAADLKRLAPREGEWEQLSAEHRRLSHGASLLAGAQGALEALAEADGATIAELAAAAGRLRALSAHDARLAPIAALLESAGAQAGEAARELRHYASRFELDPEALKSAEARIEALHAAGRRQRVRPEELPRCLAELETRVAELALAVDPAALAREVEVASQRYAQAAARLTGKRRSGARAFSQAVTEGMQRLAMAGGRFSVALAPLEAPGAAGAEDVAFEVASHPSLALRPLARVASGGELSRISLAIHLVAATASPVATLVFDEVDAGIGGAAAETVGRSLKRLGRDRQVLCVTHLPQVAAQGDAQWSISRPGARARPVVRAQLLDRAARIEELARMLGGSEATARRHAAELLGPG
jgi:DNA repair protein RecN (Recombination protein N)